MVDCKCSKASWTCAVLLVALAVAVVPAVAWAAPGTVTSETFAGADRYETAALVTESVTSGSYDAEGKSTVVLVRGDCYADGLAASGLAGLIGCQVLVTPSGTLDAGAKSLMESWDVSKVIVVGGVDAVSPAVVDELASLEPSPQVDRISGKDRFATARAVYQYGESCMRYSGPYGTLPASLGWMTGAAFVVSGDNYADALSVSPAAACLGIPVLLAENGVLSSDDLKLLEHSDTVYIAGGTEAVSSQVEADLTSQTQSEDLKVVRLAGEDRYQTCVEVAATTELWVNSGFCEDGHTLAPGGGYRKVIVATGQDYADALVAGINASVRCAVPASLYLADDTEVGRFAIDTIAQESNRGSVMNYTITFMGGESVMPDSLKQDIMAAAEEAHGA